MPELQEKQSPRDDIQPQRPTPNHEQTTTIKRKQKPEGVRGLIVFAIMIPGILVLVEAFFSGNIWTGLLGAGWIIAWASMARQM